MTTINGVGGATAATAATTSTAAGKKSDPNAVDKDMFLKLLVAQLRFQDPNRPTDPSQFLSQTAQFTTVEKLNALESLAEQAHESGRQQSAIAMIGHTVTYADASGATRTGVVTGVSVGASTPQLTIDGMKVSLDAVSAVNRTP